jgi:hypothetical protein
MKSFFIAATAVALTSGALLSTAAEAAPYHRHHGSNVTHSERAALAQSRARLKFLQRRAYADGRLGIWERMRLNAAQARHRALAYRLRHN